MSKGNNEENEKINELDSKDSVTGKETVPESIASSLQAFQPRPMACSKHGRRTSVISQKIFVSEKLNDKEIPSVLVRLIGATAPPPSLEDVETLHHCFRPLWITMRLLSAFPITFTDEGIAEFKTRSRAFAYTSFVLLMTIPPWIVSVNHRIEVFRTADFNTLIFTYKCLLYCVAYLFVPAGHFLSPERITRYINELSQFLTRVREMTGTPISINFHRNITALTVILPILVACLVIYEFYTLEAFVWYEVAFYGFIATLICYHILIWCCMCAILMKASTHIGDLLIEELRSNAWDLGIVPKYRALWVELSYMTRQTGDVLYYSYGWLLICTFTLITCTTYGFLADSNFERFSTREFGLGLNSLVLYIVLVFLTTSSHYAIDAVDGKFLRRLKQLKSPSKDVLLQLEYFQMAIRLDAPRISLGGYVIVDRGLLTSIFGAIVTYLVVLLQFKVKAESTRSVTTRSNIPLT